jgi:hypothetical protein
MCMHIENATFAFNFSSLPIFRPNATLPRGISVDQLDQLRNQLTNVTTLRQLETVLHQYNLTIVDLGVDINSLGVNVTRAIDQVTLVFHLIPLLLHH